MLSFNMKNILRFIPTPHATIEDNINNISPEFDITDDKYSFLIPS